MVTMNTPYTPFVFLRYPEIPDSGEFMDDGIRGFAIGNDLKKHGCRIDPPVVLEPVDVCSIAMA